MAVQSFTLMQATAQDISIIQRIHIVNAYAMRDRDITVRELLVRRWPELLIITAFFVVLVLLDISTNSPLKFILGGGWLAKTIMLDITISLATFNKVHRMLNTGEHALTWVWRALVSTNVATSAKTTGDNQGMTRQVVRAWLFMTISVFCAIVVYIVAWFFVRDTDLCSQEAIKQVALHNRATKKYLGQVTKTGIVMNTQLPTQTTAEAASINAADLVLSLAVIVLQSLNLTRAKSFFAKKSLGLWLSGGCLRLYSDAETPTIWALGRVEDLIVLTQTYLQVIVILQRLHMVNAHAVGASAVTLCEFLVLRRAEIFWTLGYIVMFFFMAYFTTNRAAYLAGTVWGLGMIFLDVAIAVISVSKVHRMLNTSQTALSWYWESIRRKQPKPAATTSGLTLQRSSISDNTSTIVQSWTLMILAIVASASMYVVAWYALDDSPLWYPVLRIAWLFMSVWQRGSLLYIEAIRQVGMLNRVNKQYLGTATKTGIAYETETERQKPTAVSFQFVQRE
ncbi:hypothetical protein RI367_003097 [Sorochytrium milnesiophthora]